MHRFCGFHGIIHPHLQNPELLKSLPLLLLLGSNRAFLCVFQKHCLAKAHSVSSGCSRTHFHEAANTLKTSSRPEVKQIATHISIRRAQTISTTSITQYVRHLRYQHYPRAYHISSAVGGAPENHTQSLRGQRPPTEDHSPVSYRSQLIYGKVYARPG